MKISEMITDRYKLRIPPTVYYELLADVQEVEEEQEPTTKNDLGVDLVSRPDVFEILWNYDYTNPSALIVEAIRELPSVTPQEPFINKPCVSEKVCEHDKQMVLDKIRAEIGKSKTEHEMQIAEKDIKAKLLISHIYCDIVSILDKYKADRSKEDGNNNQHN